MASQDELRQTTQTQQDSPVVFVDTHLTKLNDKKIKSIGLYTKSDLALINQLLVDLHRVFPKEYGLLDRQRIFLRLNGETTQRELITDLNFPEAVEDENSSERRSRLFLSDLARIVIGLAKTLYAIWQDEGLKEYNQSLDELRKLSDWAATGDPEYISEFDLARNAYKIQELLDLVTEVFEKQTGVDVKTEAEQIAEVAPVERAGTATVPDVGDRTSRTTDSESETDSEDSQDTNPDDTTTDPRTNSDIATEALFVSSAAYSNLIKQFLDSAGVNELNLPPELQRDLTQLNQTLRDRLFDIIEKLSPDQREKLLSHNLRLYLYQKLLIDLQQDPVFYTLLDKFYQKFAQYVYEKNGLAVAEEKIAEVERYFATLNPEQDIEPQELNETLEKIRAQIKAWKAQVAEQVEQQALEEKLETTALEDDPNRIDPQELDDHAIYRLPPPRIRFEPQQEAQLESYLNTSANLDPENRKLVQDQSARLLWGTLSELFKDDAEQLNKLPLAIHSGVYLQTLNYIMSLNKDDIEKLRTSPSSLIRHIKNNSFRILGDVGFQREYAQYTQVKTAEVISRANRVEKEVQWAYQRIIFELFSAHNITDPTVPDLPELQGIFDEVKEYLYEDLFAYIAELPNDDLLLLYLHSKDRTVFLHEIYQYLNADAAFVDNLSLLYNNMIVYYEKNQQFQQRDELKQSLNKLVQFDGRVAHIKASTPPPEVLLTESLKTIIPLDNKLIFDQSDVILRSLVVELGLQETLSLIQGNRVSVLNSVFQLPPNTLTDANIEEFRSLFSEYAKVRATQLIANSATTESMSQVAVVYPGLRLDKAIQDPSAKAPTSASSTVATQLESVRTIQTVIQSRGKDGDEVVAESTDVKTIKQKRDIVMKIFGSEWNDIGQINQVAIYLYYDLPFNEQSVKADINNNLPFPFEYIDFRAKKDYDKILTRLSEEYLRHGKKGFNPLLKSGYLEETPGADHQRKINELVLAVQAYNFAQLDAVRQLEIAQQVGYATAEEFIQEHLELSQNALSNDPQLNQIIQEMEFVDEVLAQDLAAETNVESQAFVNQYRGARSAMASVAPSPQAQLLNTLKQLGGQKIANETLKKSAVSLAAKAGLGAATAGLGTVLLIGGDLLQNKKFREFVIYGSTALVSSALYALSTIGGLLGAILGGAFGFLSLGPVGAAGGGLLGAYTGAQVLPQQWGGWMGFSPRQAPGLDMLYPENNASMADLGLRTARNGTTPNAASAAVGDGGNLLGTGTQPINASIPAANSLTASMTGATGAGATTGATAAATQAAATSGGLFTSFMGMSIGIAAPMLALFGAVFLSMATILVITAAFLVPIPTRDSDWKGDGTDGENTVETEDQFLDISKTPSVTQIENGVDTEVTYKVTVTPKNDYTIKVNEVTDTFSKSAEGGPELVSGFSEGNFPIEPFAEPLTFEYSVTMGQGLTDTRVTNTLTINYEAVDRSGFTVQRNGVLRTSASVSVGTPVEGCWPVQGSITQLPYGHSSHGSGSFNSDAYDIGASAGTEVYAPYSGKLCSMPFDSGGYGNYLKLTVPMNGAQLIFIFAHLQNHIIPASDPDDCVDVVASDLIGRVDSTGNSTGHHLHYELVNDYPTGGLTLNDLVPKEGGLPSIGDTIRDCHQ